MWDLIKAVINVIVGIFRIAFTLLSLIPYGIAKLIALVIKTLKGDTKDEKFKKELREFLSDLAKGGEYVQIVKGDPAVLQDAELKHVTFSMEALTNENIRRLISEKEQEKIKIPNVVGFKVSKVSGEDLRLSGDGGKLPLRMKTLLILTSPKMRITIEADGHRIEAEFNAFECFQKYGKVSNNMMTKFVMSYLGLRSDVNDEEILSMIAEVRGLQA